MKAIYLLLLICAIASCEKSPSKDEPLKLKTSNVEQLMAEIDSMPIAATAWQIEVDDKGRTIDTTSKTINKYYQDDKLAYSHNTRYMNDNEAVFEQYFIPNGEFIYQRLSNQKMNYSSISLAEIDSTGLVLGLTMFYKKENAIDTVNINYDYTFNELNQRETLLVGVEKDAKNFSHCVNYKDDKVIREYDLANGDTIALSTNEYQKGELIKSTHKNFHKGQLSRSKESHYNKDRNIVLSTINNYRKGEEQEFIYKYNNEKRLSSHTVEDLTKKETRYYKVLYLKQ